MCRLSAALLVVFLVVGSGVANAQVATLTYPANGSKIFDARQAVTWTGVAGAEKYYVYVSRAMGGNELHNSGELAPSVLSRQLTGLPTGEMLWLRLWTRVAGIWRYQDYSFGSFVAYLEPPFFLSDGQLVNWTPIATAAYYVYVGTTPGATDIKDSGEIQVACCSSGVGLTVPSPPPGITYYVRLWTKVAGVWRYTDGTVNPLVIAELTSPSADVVTDLTTFQWTSVPNAQSYYLYVGTTQGASDVINSWELHTTQFAAGVLPRGKTLYVRLWTKLGGVWRFSDSTVTIAGAKLTYPANGATSFLQSIGLQWTYVPGAAYKVWVGTTPGGSEVYQSPESDNNYLHGVSFPLAQQLYVRVWTKWGSTWVYTDSQFSVLAASITSPATGTFARGSQQMSWESIPGAQAYYVYVGRTVGGSDLVNSYELHQTSYTARVNYSGSHVYVRLWTRLAGVWRYTDFIYDLS